MMRAMKKALVGVAVALAACGGGAKQADSPGTCPDGTVLKGSDCVPADLAGDTSDGRAGGGDDAPKKTSHPKASDSDTPAGDTAGGGGGSGGSGGGYDKDEIEVKMKRVAKQIKSNCGAATDDEGKATGPWGTVKATIVLGRNGHVGDVTVDDTYKGKPVGTCVSRALLKLVFSPYAGSSDATIER